MATDPSAEVLAFKDRSPEEIAAEKAADAAAAARREAEELADEAVRLSRRQAAFERLSPEIILAGAVDRHTIALNRIAAVGEAFVEQVTRIADLYMNKIESDRGSGR